MEINRPLQLALAALFLGVVAKASPTQKFVTQFSLSSPELPERLTKGAQPEPWTDAEAGPVPKLRLYATEKSGAVWLGSSEGAARFDRNASNSWDRWQYFYGPRWLKDNNVRHIWVDAANPTLKVWILTASGASRLEWRPMTLAEKAAYFEERIERRHVRHGLVADCGLRAAGDLSTSFPTDTDNDGLWTSIYLAAEAHRFAVTHASDARAKARRSLEALIRLEAITGKPGFFARTFLSTNETLHSGPEWHFTADRRWQWKGTTSSDEAVGHYFAYSTYFDLVANESEKAEIRRVVRRITDHIIEHDYTLEDLDGQPTRWGNWSEKYFQTEEGKYESALRSLELLSFLKTTHHITGDAKYETAYQDRIKHGYAENMRHYRRWPGGGEINFSDDELAYLSYGPLLKYERNSKLRKIYLDGLRFTWTQVRPDMNPLWNYISAASGAGRMGAEVRAESRRTLERIPMDLLDWPARNSHRRDIQFQSEKDRHDIRQLTVVLAPDERAVSKWNGNPYIPDGGGAGYSEDDGAFFLLPYWIGRYHGWVE